MMFLDPHLKDSTSEWVDGRKFFEGVELYSEGWCFSWKVRLTILFLFALLSDVLVMKFRYDRYICEELCQVYRVWAWTIDNVCNFWSLKIGLFAVYPWFFSLYNLFRRFQIADNWRIRYLTSRCWCGFDHSWSWWEYTKYPDCREEGLGGLIYVMAKEKFSAGLVVCYDKRITLSYALHWYCMSWHIKYLWTLKRFKSIDLYTRACNKGTKDWVWL